jgi:hypothetical protein
LIVADGPSAAIMRTQVVPQDIYIIAVNGAVQWLPRVDAFFTLDPCDRQRWLMRNQRLGVRYFAAVPPLYGDRRAPQPSHRAKREANVTFLKRIEGGGPMASAKGMNNDPNCINTGNSAWGALGLAHHMKPERIALVGVDANSGPRVSGGRPGNLDHLPWLFETYDGPAEVVNGSPRSAIEAFPKMTATEAIQWLL